MKIVVGLGNPGKSYEKTRHNVGFRVIDSVADFYGVKKYKQKKQGLYFEIETETEKIIFLKPQSYMNLSGIVVKNFVDYFKVKTEEILIISDDIDLPIGKIRIKPQGSSGGHNGLKNIEETIGSPEYKRIKIGINNGKLISAEKFVLEKFSKKENEEIEKIIVIVKNIIFDYLKEDFNNLMNKYN